MNSTARINKGDISPDQTLGYLPLSEYGNVVEAFMQEGVITHSEDPMPYAATFGLGSCVAIVGWSPELKLGFVTHLDNSKYLEKLGNLYYHVNKFAPNENIVMHIYLVGGQKGISDSLIQDIRYNLIKWNYSWKSNNIEFKLIREFLNENNPSSICLDTRNGKLYLYDGKNSQFSKLDDIQTKTFEIRCIINCMKPDLKLDIKYCSSVSITV